MTTTNILFDKASYVAGENVSGRVEIRNTSSMNIRYISLMIQGSADTHWTERESYTENGESKSRTITYSAHEQYLNSTSILYGQQGGQTIQLPPGTHTYNFACSLPRELPGSKSGQYGKIVYMAKVKFDIPWAFDDKFQREFHVEQYLDLNEDPSMRLPSEMEAVRKYCAWNCSTSPVVITVTTPQSGFVKHDEIPVSIHIVNNSNVELQGVQTKLIKRFVCHSHSPSHQVKTEETKLDYTKIDLLHKRKDREINITTKLKVPTTPATCNRSSIVRVVYQIGISIYSLGCHNTKRLYTSITIGTFPIRAIGDTNTILPQMPSLHAPIAPIMEPEMNMPMPVVPPPLPGSSPAHATAPYPPTIPSASMPTAPTEPSLDENAPPPSYSEVVYGWKNDEKTYNSPNAPASSK